MISIYLLPNFTNLCILVSISVKLEMTGRYFVTGWKIFYCGWKIGWKIPHSKACLPAFIVFTVRVLRRFWEIWQIFSHAELLCVAASLPSGHFSAFIITPPLALDIATMSTANVFGLFLLAPITDVLSHWCLGATPGSVGAF